MDPLKTYFLLNMGIFHCYVSLPEGTYFLRFEFSYALAQVEDVYINHIADLGKSVLRSASHFMNASCSSPDCRVVCREGMVTPAKYKEIQE